MIVIFLIALSFGITAGHESRILGNCPNHWRDIGDSCFKYRNEYEGFFGALRGCHGLESHENVDQRFKEDLSLLLTIGKLYEFEKDGNTAADFFTRPIRINAVSFRGSWFEIHKVPQDHFEIEDAAMGGFGQEISQDDFDLFGALMENPQDVDDYSSLVYDAKAHSFKIVSIGKEYHYGCIHKRENRPGQKCQGIVSECNDKGTCYFGKCECLDGYIGEDCFAGTTTTTTTTTTPDPLACPNGIPGRFNPDANCITSWVGDSLCDDDNNIPDCCYDGNDCCLPGPPVGECTACACITPGV